LSQILFVVIEVGPMKTLLVAEPNEERKSADQSQFYMDVERPSFLHGCKKRSFASLWALLIFLHGLIGKVF